MPLLGNEECRLKGCEGLLWEEAAKVQTNVTVRPLVSAGVIDAGRKNDFQLLSCQTYAALYTKTDSDMNQEQDYDAYHTAQNLTEPTFIKTVLDDSGPVRTLPQESKPC